MQSLIRSKSAGVTGGRGTAGAGPGRDLLYFTMGQRTSMCCVAVRLWAIHHDKNHTKGCQPAKGSELDFAEPLPLQSERHCRVAPGGAPSKGMLLLCGLIFWSS